MTVHVTNPEAAAEVEAKAALLTRATVAYIARLKAIADIGTLAAGAHGFDYAVTVAQSEKLALLPRLSDLTMAIEDEFGVKITTLAVAGSSRAGERKTGDRAPVSLATTGTTGRRASETLGAITSKRRNVRGFEQIVVATEAPSKRARNK